MNECVRPFALSPTDQHLLVQIALEEPSPCADSEQLRQLMKQGFIRRSGDGIALTRKAIRLVFGGRRSARVARAMYEQSKITEQSQNQCA